ncbi:MAG: hypothetical protein WEB60_07695 [Terrimicrobiaceae bacterium]
MKIPTTLSILGLSLSIVSAQMPDAAQQEAPPSQRPGEKIKDRVKDKMLQGLSPENRTRFEEARKKALEDPRIAALREKAESSNREFFDAMRTKMNEIDPGLEQILKDNRGSRPGKDGKKRDREGGMSSLSEAERQRLNAARETAKTDPAVQAAEKKRNEAKTPEERHTAAQEFGKAVRDAIIKLDPSMATILDKVNPGK